MLRRVLHAAATIAFIVLMIGVVVIGFGLLRRVAVDLMSNWPLSYEDTPEARTEMARNTSQAGNALLLFAVDVLVGAAGVTGFAALKRVRWLAWMAGTFTGILFLIDLAVLTP